MEICALVVSILSFVLSLVATIISSIIANKPYYKKLCLSETFSGNQEEFGVSISNIGRTVVYIGRVELVEIKTNKILGQIFFHEDDQHLYSVEPGNIKYVKLHLHHGNPYAHQYDPNKYLKVVVYEKDGKISEYKNIFAVG